jgi:serine/threonine-protein kinase RsbW
MESESTVHNSIVLANQISELEHLCQKLLTQARENGFSDEEIFAIHRAIEEAFLNAVKHGNKMDVNKKVKVDYLINKDKFDISVEDDGSGFRPSEVPDPRNGENLYKSSGRGLLLMQSYMDSVRYNEQGNCVHMVKYRQKTDSGSEKNI